MNIPIIHPTWRGNLAPKENDNKSEHTFAHPRTSWSMPAHNQAVTGIHGHTFVTLCHRLRRGISEASVRGLEAIWSSKFLSGIPHPLTGEIIVSSLLWMAPYKTSRNPLLVGRGYPQDVGINVMIFGGRFWDILKWRLRTKKQRDVTYPGNA